MIENDITLEQVKQLLLYLEKNHIHGWPTEASSTEHLCCGTCWQIRQAIKHLSETSYAKVLPPYVREVPAEANE